MTFIMKEAVKICWYIANKTVQCSIVSLDLCLLANGNVFSDLNITIYTSLTGKYTGGVVRKKNVLLAKRLHYFI